MRALLDVARRWVGVANQNKTKGAAAAFAVFVVISGASGGVASAQPTDVVPPPVYPTEQPVEPQPVEPVAPEPQVPAPLPPPALPPEPEAPLPEQPPAPQAPEPLPAPIAPPPSASKPPVESAPTEEQAPTPSVAKLPPAETQEETEESEEPVKAPAPSPSPTPSPSPATTMTEAPAPEMTPEAPSPSSESPATTSEEAVAPSETPEETGASTTEQAPATESEPGETGTPEEGAADESAESTSASEESASTEPTAPPEPPQESTTQDEAGQPDSAPTSSSPAEDALNVTPLLEEGVTAQEPESLQAPSEEAVTKAANSTPVDVEPQFSEQNREEIFDSLVSAARERDRDNGESGRDRDRDERPWDGRIDHWKWVKYDNWHRPILYNPCNQPVRILYYYENRPYYAYIPVQGSVRINFQLSGVVPFTVFNLSGSIALNVSGGYFVGGGWYPHPGAYYPPPGWVPPPPPRHYTNVIVVVKNVNIYYAPTRVKQVVVVNDCNGRRGCQDCVLIDGTHRVWGSWQTGRGGNRYFLATQSEKMPGFDQRVEGPSDSLARQYNLDQLGTEQEFDNKAQQAEDQGSKDLLFIGLAAVVMTGLTVIVWLVTRGRRRPQHL